mmetsp:Transcript_60508/g.143112  ORF Transcript_60508/g.143112 Transcript_60508/m.143112 type:complete len:170 (+) Transcript_60508:1650-2159(+)
MGARAHGDGRYIAVMKPKAEGNYAAIPDDQVCVASLFDPAAAVAQMSCKYRMETTGMRDSNGRELTQKLAKSCLQKSIRYGQATIIRAAAAKPFLLTSRLAIEIPSAYWDDKHVTVGKGGPGFQRFFTVGMRARNTGDEVQLGDSTLCVDGPETPRHRAVGIASCLRAT